MGNCIIGTYEKENKRSVTMYTVKLIHDNVYQIRIDLIAKNNQSTNIILKDYKGVIRLLKRNNLIDREGFKK